MASMPATRRRCVRAQRLTQRGPAWCRKCVRGEEVQRGPGQTRRRGKARSAWKLQPAKHVMVGGRGAPPPSPAVPPLTQTTQSEVRPAVAQAWRRCQHG